VRNRSLLALLAVIAVSGMTAVAAEPSPAASNTPVVKIGVLAPLNAGLVEFGAGIRNSVQIAVDRANKDHLVKGWRIELVAMNDSSDAATGAAGAAKLVADPGVLGVVGTYNSGVAVAALPALSAAHLALVSPGNTLADLTRGPNPASPTRPYDDYFRVVASDAEQAPFLADSVWKMGVRNVAVVSETKAVSKGLADSFVPAFEQHGGKVTVRQVVPDGTGNFTDFLNAAKTAKPDMIFFGGEYKVAAVLRTQATAAGLTVPLVGGDGIKDPTFIGDAGSASRGTLASTVGVPAEKLAGAKPFLAAYSKARFSQPATDFGPYAYDAANVLIKSFAKVLKGKTSVPSDARAKVVAGVQATHSTGITGRLGFDKYGDTTNPVFTLYKVDTAKGSLDWVAVKA
jgi:branched-chain amino acid transport system substrate-binding protein